ncbi:suppressor of fused domain protein [Paenibacillus sp. Soil787]|uniref:suppressor of fused domain protein n=1 Tax=Paenibacillus sp. Soil787 TaxID=1736411 RepID=UPI0007023D3D|nr:suppressor of fused domain protein [Paenibacillus sp. Soil787]KRF13681.1 hypothetical protein ASG93_14330 [Paenibacillus sp. Soil787]
MKNVELFLNHIEEVFGDNYQIKRIESKDGGTPVHLFIYRDLPETGLMTFITYGLSEVDHSEWINGKPELILTLETSDLSWGYAIAGLVAERRGIKRFSYGDLFTSDEPISDDSEMVGFFVFSPSGLDKESQKIVTEGKPIFLAGMYPIYREEVQLYNLIGLKEFWFTEGFELYNPRRKNLASMAAAKTAVITSY